MTRPARCVVSAFVFLLASFPSLSAAAPRVVERAGFASISVDDAQRTWTIASSGSAIVLGLHASRDFEIVRASTQSGRRWALGGLPDTFLRIGTKTVAFGSRPAGFVYTDVTTSATGLTVQINATFDLPASRLRATRHYAATSGSPAFETWTTVAPLQGAVTLSDLNAFQLTVPAGAMHWVNGLLRDDASMPTDAAFTLQDRELAPGEHLVLGAEGRSSEQTVPWFAIDNGEDTFFAGLMWSGGWSLAAERSNAGIELTLGLAPMATSVTSAVDGPHAFFGVAQGDLRDASAATRSFVMEGIRGGRALDALVTYNTWFAYGTRIDERTIREEMHGAAELGAELFVMDAGWYVGTGRDSVFDFTSGLGSWEVDEARFPEGVKALTDYAHSLGLKFGIWVEPERVAQSTVGRSGLAQEEWLASVGGKYGSPQAAQICLASAAARQWVLDEVTRLLDEVQPDYLKWDNNFWLNCDRDGHGHGRSDGNFGHVNGLYDVLAQLRARYPDLLIENVSGGGNRLDFGMLRYSDVGWMDDRSAPSVHVRHIVEGLGVVFPPAYLLSFVMHHDEEPINDASDLSLYFRTRMTGVLGLCFRTSEFDASAVAQISREIQIYKELRDSLGAAAGSLLNEQAAVVDGPAWDVFQSASPGGRTVVLSAIQWDDAVGEHIVTPVGLRPESTYDIESVDAGVLGTATGAELMADGIMVMQSPDTAAHILILRRQ